MNYLFPNGLKLVDQLRFAPPLRARARRPLIERL